MKKILVVGALQNEGEEIADFLLKRNEKVVLGLTQIEQKQKKHSLQTEVVAFDFADIKSCDKAIENVNKILIINSYNIRPTEGMKSFINLLQSKKKIELVCILTLNGVEKSPLFAKDMNESFFEKTKLPFCIIRTNFYMKKIKGIYENEFLHSNEIIVPEKCARVSYINEQDTYDFIATILCQVEGHRNKSYIITGQEALDYFKVEELLTKITGRSIQYAGLKTEMVKEYWKSLREADCEYADDLGMQHMISRMGIAEEVTDTFSKIMKREPQKLQEYIYKTIEKIT